MRRWPAGLLAALLAVGGTAAAQEQPPAAEQAPAPEQPPAPAWLPRPAARLILLDKIAAQPRTMTVKVGSTVQFGSLSITVGACDVRPPDKPQDAAAFLQITDSHAGMPGFSGWMLVDEPGLSMLQHPTYDVRLAGCTG
jgi:hypothetical protein